MLTENELEVLLETLLDFDTDIPCQELSCNDEQCYEHCKGQTKECWIRFAKAVADDSDSVN